MPPPTSRVCLVTVTTERFVPGTLVTLGSFQRHHPDFNGDVVHEALPEAHRRRLAEACPRLRFEPVSAELGERLAALSAACPDFTPRLSQFYSLEAFRLSGYRKVLFYDSDVLFQAPVGELFGSAGALLCCGDDVFLRGWRRDAGTFAPLRPAQRPGAAGTLDRTFGAGFLLIDAALVEEGCYDSLLALVSPETWRGTTTTHTDQIVLNRCFAGRQTLVGWTYDFALPMAESIRLRDGVCAATAKVLHFAGPIKPWMPDALLRWTSGDPRFKPIQAFKTWWNVYVDCLAAAHVQSARRGAAIGKDACRRRGREPHPGGEPRPRPADRHTLVRDLPEQ